MSTAKIIGPNFVTVMVDGTVHNITSDHRNYAKIREELKKAKPNMKEVSTLINVIKSVAKFAAGKVTVQNGSVMYGKEVLHGAIVERILSMISEGFDSAPMLNFLENLMQNPSKRAVDELYKFLEVTSLPITEDGCFLAYKKVADNFMDLYTGTMDNSVGKVVEMPRNGVDEDKDRTCSAGLHFCSLSYLPHYHGGAGRVMIVKINPADVVAIPSDYNNAKGRTCRYEVIGEHTAANKESVDAFTSSVYAGATPAVPKPRASVRNPSLVGYNAGRSDASRGKTYDNSTKEFTGDELVRYTQAYAKGFGANGAAAPTPTPAARPARKNGSAAYNAGHDDGYSDAQNDEPYDGTVPSGEHYNADEYGRGYSDGFDAGTEDYDI